MLRGNVHGVFGMSVISYHRSWKHQSTGFTMQYKFYFPILSRNWNYAVSFNQITWHSLLSTGKPDYPAVEEFGSFVMDLFSPTSDLDLSVNFSKDAAEYPRDKKIKALRKFLKKFYALQSNFLILLVLNYCTSFFICVRLPLFLKNWQQCYVNLQW